MDEAGYKDIAGTQLDLYSEYEEVIEVKENYIKGRKGVIIVGKDENTALLFGCIVFPYAISEE